MVSSRESNQEKKTAEYIDDIMSRITLPVLSSGFIAIMPAFAGIFGVKPDLLNSSAVHLC